MTKTDASNQAFFLFAWRRLPWRTVGAIEARSGMKPEPWCPAHYRCGGLSWFKPPGLASPRHGCRLVRRHRLGLGGSLSYMEQTLYALSDSFPDVLFGYTMLCCSGRLGRYRGRRTGVGFHRVPLGIATPDSSVHLDLRRVSGGVCVLLLFARAGRGPGDLHGTELSWRRLGVRHHYPGGERLVLAVLPEGPQCDRIVFLGAVAGGWDTWASPNSVDCGWPRCIEARAGVASWAFWSF